MRIGVALYALGLAVLPLQQAGAWGTAGHSIVAEIAQHRLEPKVLRKIKALLGGDVSLAAVANWADSTLLVRPETKNWHFVNIPVGASGYDPARDCRDTPHGDCIVNALTRLRGVLADRRAPKRQRAEALMFLVHLVGDIHQPLHCADRNGDAGATTLMVSFYGQRMSLHLLWDVGLIEKRTYDWGEHVRILEREWLNGRIKTKGQRSTPADWAWQSHLLAVQVAYALPEDFTLSEAYYERSRPILERQLALAGVRLARLLNEALK